MPLMNFSVPLSSELLSEARTTTRRGAAAREEAPAFEAIGEEAVRTREDIAREEGIVLRGENLERERQATKARD